MVQGQPHLQSEAGSMKSDLSNSLPPEVVQPPTAEKGSRLISRVLPPAVRLWIQSQLDQVEALEFHLEGKDRQLLSGYVPQISLSAAKAVYRGLHLSQVQAAATEIRINLGQMLRGKPLKLLQPFPVQGHVCLYAEDLLLSLHSPLLAQGLQDVLLRLGNAHPALFPEGSPMRALIADFSEASATTDITLHSGQITLRWAPGQTSGETITLATGLQIREGNMLSLHQPQVTIRQGDPSSAEAITLDDYVINLGPEVDIQALTVMPDLIEIRGTVRVIPGN